MAGHSLIDGSLSYCEQESTFDRGHLNLHCLQARGGTCQRKQKLPLTLSGHLATPHRVL